MGVGGLLPRRVGWIIVHVKHGDGLSGQQPQPLERRAPAVQVVDVRQDASLLAPAVDGDQGGLAQAPQRLRTPPDFHVRHDADLASRVDQGGVAFGGGQQIHLLVGRPSRRGRDPPPADGGHQFHLVPGLFQGFGPPGGVVHDPVEEADRPLHRQSRVRGPPGQVLGGPAALDVRLDRPGPGLDAVVARPNGQVDLPVQGELVAHDRAGVETVAEGLVLGSLGCASRLGAGLPRSHACQGRPARPGQRASPIGPVVKIHTDSCQKRRRTTRRH